MEVSKVIVRYSKDLEKITLRDRSLLKSIDGEEGVEIHRTENSINLRDTFQSERFDTKLFLYIDYL